MDKLHFKYVYVASRKAKLGNSKMGCMSECVCVLILSENNNLKCKNKANNKRQRNTLEKWHRKKRF